MRHTESVHVEAQRIARTSGRRVGIFPTGADDGRYRHWDWVSETPGKGFTGAGPNWRTTIAEMVLPNGTFAGFDAARAYCASVPA